MLLMLGKLEERWVCCWWVLMCAATGSRGYGSIQIDGCLCGCLALWKGWSGLHPVATHVLGTTWDNACLTWSQCGDWLWKNESLIDVATLFAQLPSIKGGSTLSSLAFVLWSCLCCTTVWWYVDCEQQAPMSRKTDKELEEPCYRYVQNGPNAWSWTGFWRANVRNKGAARYSQHAAAIGCHGSWLTRLRVSQPPLYCVQEQARQMAEDTLKSLPEEAVAV